MAVDHGEAGSCRSGRVRLLAALLLTSAGAAGAAPGVRTMIAAPQPRPGWFVCDSVDTPWAVLVGPVAKGTSTITLDSKKDGTATTARYTVGRADPGAGQIYYALSRNGREVGNLHAVNPGMLDPSLPPPLNFTSVSIGDRRLSCRLVNHVQLIAVTARRGVTVTREGKALVYRSYNFAGAGPVEHPDGVQRTNAPSLRIAGGTRTGGEGGAAGFRFANAGYTYTITLPAGTAPGTLGVTRAGRTILKEKLLGFTLVDG
jgi:hypothetical protein